MLRGVERIERLSETEGADLSHRLIDPTRPVLVGVGPTEFSVSISLEPWPSLIYDVNGYYRDLGVHPRATRKEIRDAFVALDGNNSKRITMIVKTLFDPDARLQYDLSRPGDIFWDDEVLANLMEVISGVAEVAEPGEGVPLTDIRDAAVAQDEANREIAHLMLHDQSWSYYLLNCDVEAVYAQRVLTEWRSKIIQEMSENGQTGLKLAVGFQSGDAASLVRVGVRWVALLGERLIPTRALASSIVSQYITMSQTGAENQWHVISHAEHPQQ